MSDTNSSILTFDSNTVDLFKSASRDFNPLHVDAQYARTTAFGKPVVFGMLALIAALSKLPDRADRELQSIKVQLKNAMFADVRYDFASAQTGDPATVRFHLADGTRQTLAGRALFRTGVKRKGAPTAVETPCGAGEASQPRDFIAGTHVRGSYRPDWKQLEALSLLYNCANKGIPDYQIAVLMGCSYVVGMHLPGRQALFLELTTEFEESERATTCCPGEFRFDAEISSFDERFNTLSFSLIFSDASGNVIARAEILSLVRPNAMELDSLALRNALSGCPALTGKTAVVIGGSRGLGRAIGSALAALGARAYCTHSSARADIDGAENEGAIYVPADATDKESCRALKERVIEECGGIDLLICNAAPAPQVMPIHDNTAERMLAYLNESIACAVVPMSALLPEINRQAGCCVVISSEFVETAPPNLAHYVSAKHAIEGFTKAAAVEYSSASYLIVRPPRLLTDWASSSLQSHDLMKAEDVAGAICRALGGASAKAEPGSVEVLEQFEANRAPSRV